MDFWLKILILCSLHELSMAQNSMVDYDDYEEYEANGSLDYEDDIGDPHFSSAIFAGSIALIIWPIVDRFRIHLENTWAWATWKHLEEYEGCGNGNLTAEQSKDEEAEAEIVKEIMKVDPETCLSNCEWLNTGNSQQYSFKVNLTNNIPQSTSCHQMFWHLFSEELRKVLDDNVYEGGISPMSTFDMSISPLRVPNDISCVDTCLQNQEIDFGKRFLLKFCKDNILADETTIPLRQFMCYTVQQSLRKTATTTKTTSDEGTTTTTSTTTQTRSDEETTNSPQTEGEFVTSNPLAGETVNYRFSPTTVEEEVFSYCLVDLMNRDSCCEKINIENAEKIPKEWKKLNEVFNGRPIYTPTTVSDKLFLYYSLKGEPGRWEISEEKIDGRIKMFNRKDSMDTNCPESLSGKWIAYISISITMQCVDQVITTTSDSTSTESTTSPATTKKCGECQELQVSSTGKRQLNGKWLKQPTNLNRSEPVYKSIDTNNDNYLFFNNDRWQIAAELDGNAKFTKQATDKCPEEFSASESNDWEAKIDSEKTTVNCVTTTTTTTTTTSSSVADDTTEDTDTNIAADYERLIKILSNVETPTSPSKFCSQLLGLNFAKSTILRESTQGGDEKTPKANIKLFRTPWLCNLRSKGFRGRHRCGVTLLSGPDQWRDPILVSAAHCNAVCRDMLSYEILENCCCLRASDFGSCREDSSYCSEFAQMDIINESEIQIVCDKNSLERVPLASTDEVVLEVKKIVNHPDYKPGKPIEGHDIAIYHVKPNKKLRKQMRDKVIVPACFPKYPIFEDEVASNERIVGPGGTFNSGSPVLLKGFKDPTPTYKLKTNLNTTLNDYVNNNLLPVVVQFFRKKECRDPKWMGSNTSYPQGVACYKTKGEDCVVFGNSGSPMVEEYNLENGEKKFFWVGPLSLSKGCDQTEYKDGEPSSRFKGDNPAVFTDGNCYMDWIAKEYGFKPPKEWKKNSTCTNGGTGDKKDRNYEDCRTNRGTLCDFSKSDRAGNPWKECRLMAEEGFSYNAYTCIDTEGVIANCANSCKGVNPNAIVAGGAAVAFAAPLSPFIYGTPMVGGLAAAGMNSMMNGGCMPGQCMRRGRCCTLRMRRGRPVCPRTC